MAVQRRASRYNRLSAWSFLRPPRPLRILHVEGTTDPAELKRLRLRYAGKCASCGRPLVQGSAALYRAATKQVWCLECGDGQDEPHPAPQQEIAGGVAGSSAQREHDRRAAARVVRVKDRWGDRVGGLVLAVTDDPQSTKAWEKGAKGERKLAVAVARVQGVVVLHDRSVKGTRGNIDHIIVAPGGVFVVDAKNYDGEVRVRDKGGLFKTDLRLYVGSHDCSALADAMGWQVREVRGALAAAGFDVLPQPVLCFVDATWPLVFPPSEFRGVRLESPRSLRKLVVRDQVLSAADVEAVCGALGRAFPPK